MEKEKILQRYRQEGVDEGREEANRRGGVDNIAVVLVKPLESGVTT